MDGGYLAVDGAKRRCQQSREMATTTIDRSVVQDLCAAMCGIARSKRAIQKMVDRVSQTIAPHGETIGRAARLALIHCLDETPWFTGDRTAPLPLASQPTYARANKAGNFARRLLLEGGSLWAFLDVADVAPS
jgi:hypothetical protein